MIEPVNRDTREYLRELLLATCLDGACYELAIALHRGTGLPLVGLWGDTASGDDGVPGTWRHAAVRLPDGDLFDARGRVPVARFGSPFGEPLPWKIRDVTEADLRAVRLIRETTNIAKMAQVVWPDLPWCKDSFQARMSAFLDDLDALSRKHGIWIRSPYPAAKPHLAESFADDKTGYQAGVTDDGLGVVFDRIFK